MTKIITTLFLLSTALLSAQSFKVIGYLPTYRFSWLEDIEFERLTHVNIAFANPNAQGEISFGGTNITPAVTKAHSKGCKVFISLAGGYLDPATEAIWDSLALPANRPAFIQKIIQYVQNQDLDGVDLDLEWQYVKDWYSPFVLELKAALSPLNIPLSVALPGKYRYPKITAPALAAFDWVNMMIYDLTGPFDPSNPGQHSPYPWAEQCVTYWKNQGVPAGKLTLGVPFYGYDFGVSPVASFTYRGIVNQDTTNAYLDQIGQKFWNGIPTIHAKTALALEKVGGVMIWEIGQDAFGVHQSLSLLRTIDALVVANSVDTKTATTDALSIFPNPVHDRLWVTNDTPDTHHTVWIINAQGKIVLEESTTNDASIGINVAHLPNGLYGVLLTGEQYNHVGKFIKN